MTPNTAVTRNPVVVVGGGIAGRARKAMAAYNAARVRPSASVQRAAQHALVQFLKCLERNDVAGVEALLATDVRTVTDGGGEFQAALRPIIGPDKVMRFYLAFNARRKDTFLEIVSLNGAPAVVMAVQEATGTAAPRYAIAIDLNRDGKIAHIYVALASRKLTAIASMFDRIASRQPA
jgi:RNA polymerase sigma-70 factor (ECF subfamily)